MMQQYLLYGLAVKRHRLRNCSDPIGFKPPLLPYALKVIAPDKHSQQVAQVDARMSRLETGRKFNVVQNGSCSNAAGVLPLSKGLPADHRAIGESFGLVPDGLEIAYPPTATLKQFIVARIPNKPAAHVGPRLLVKSPSKSLQLALCQVKFPTHASGIKPLEAQPRQCFAVGSLKFVGYDFDAHLRGSGSRATKPVPLQAGQAVQPSQLSASQQMVLHDPGPPTGGRSPRHRSLDLGDSLQQWLQRGSGARQHPVARLVSLQEVLPVRGHPKGKGAHIQRPEHLRNGQSLVARKVAGRACLLVD